MIQITKIPYGVQEHCKKGCEYEIEKSIEKLIIQTDIIFGNEPTHFFSQGFN